MLLPLIMLLAIITTSVVISVKTIRKASKNPNPTNTTPTESTTKFCSNCGSEVYPNAVICVKCGCSIPQINPLADDIPSLGLNILSFFIPLVGLILFAVYNSTAPTKSTAIGKCALTGFLLPLCAVASYFIFAVICTLFLY